MGININKVLKVAECAFGIICVGVGVRVGVGVGWDLCQGVYSHLHHIISYIMLSNFVDPNRITKSTRINFPLQVRP
jgi:hypothetical protein